MNNSAEKPLVSVCCITFNQVSYIRQCLDGILMQKTTFPFEVIIHDDCSTDGTTDIIREYQQKFPNIIKPIIQKENQYSKGVRKILATFVYPKCEGTYFAICEGDDYWTDENKLQLQVDFLEKNPEYSMCFHRAKILNELELNSPLNSSEVSDREYSGNELFENWIVPTASIVFRRNMVDIKNNDRYSPLNGDIIIVLNCAKIGKIRGMNREMSVYRIHGSGVTYNKDLQKQRLLRYPEHYNYIKDNYPFISRRIINKALFYSYIRIWVIDKKFVWLKKAFALQPVRFIFFILLFPVRKIYRKFLKRK